MVVMCFHGSFINSFLILKLAAGFVFASFFRGRGRGKK